jgi:hypothetical protein
MTTPNVWGARSPAWNAMTVNDGKTGYMELLFPWQTPGNGLFRVDEDGNVTAASVSASINVLGTVNVKSPIYGAQGNGQYTADGAMSSGTTTLTSATANFQPTDTGKRIIVYGAGAGGIHASGTLTYVSATQVTTSFTAGTTVSGAIIVWATDDTAAVAAASLAAGGNQNLYFPYGIYIVNTGSASPISSLNGNRVYGDGAGSAGSTQAFSVTTLSYGTTIVCDPASTVGLFPSTSVGPREIDHLQVIWTPSGSKILATSGPPNGPNFIHDCRFEVNDPAGNGQVVASFVEDPFGMWERVTFAQTSSTRQVPLFQCITTGSGAEANQTFQSCQWINIGFDNNQYLCDIEFQGASSGGDGYTMQMAWRDNIFVRAWGGAVKCLGAMNPVIENCGLWDLADASAPTTGNHSFYFGEYSGAAPCRNVRIIGGFKNRSWSNGTTLWDVYCESTTIGIRIDNFSTKPASNTQGANFYVNLNGCTDAVLMQNQIASGNNPGTTVVSNPSPGQVTVSNGLISPAPSTWVPSDVGFLGWTYDPALTGQAITPTTGVIWLARLNVRTPITVTNIILVLKTAGVTLTANENFAGLYNSSGTLVGGTADQSTAWTTNGTKTITLAGGPYAINPGVYFVAVVSNFTGSAPVFHALQNDNATITNIGLAASAARAATNGTGTSLSTLTLSSNTVQQQILWAGIS